MYVVPFDLVDLFLEFDDFGCNPDDLDVDSLSIVMRVEDECPVDVSPLGFLGRPIFPIAFKFFSVRRARFGGLSAPVSMDLSGLRFQACGLWVCSGQRYSSRSHMSILLIRNNNRG